MLQCRANRVRQPNSRLSDSIDAFGDSWQPSQAHERQLHDDVGLDADMGAEDDIGDDDMPSAPQDWRSKVVNDGMGCQGCQKPIKVGGWPKHKATCQPYRLWVREQAGRPLGEEREDADCPRRGALFHPPWRPRP